jgi:hypothetical protein
VRGLTADERRVLNTMALPFDVLLPVPDEATVMILRDLTSHGRVVHWFERDDRGDEYERWSISWQGLDALRLVPEQTREALP